MKKLTLSIAAYCIFLSIAGCGNKTKDQGQGNSTTAVAKDTSGQALMQAVRAVEGKLKASATLETFTANLGIAAYLDYAKYYPGDTMSAAFLFNAGGLASSTGQYAKAIDIYNNVVTKYPQSRLVPECLLVEGFIYDNNLQDTAKSRQKYTELVTKYPNDSLSIQARQAMKFLGKSADEIGKEFEEQNKAKEKKAHKKTQA